MGQLQILHPVFADCRMLKLRHRAADRPGNFFARNEAVRVAAIGIYDIFAAFQVVKMAGLPRVGAANCQHPINARHNFAQFHLLRPISAETAEFIVRVAKR